MGTPVIVTKFDEANQPTIAALNANFEALVATINALAADTLLQFGTVPGNLTGYMPTTGGEFFGQISAPSILVGPSAGPKYDVVSTNNLGTTSVPGIVKKAVAVVDLVQAITNPPTQAEVTAIQNKVNELLASLRAAGSLA